MSAAAHSTPFTKERVALVSLVLGALGISFAPIFVRWSEIGPTPTAVFRLALAAPILWAMRAAWEGDRRVALRLPDLRRLAVPGIFFAADLGIWHWSIRFTTVADATLLANFAAIFVTLFGFLFFGRKVRPVFLVGLVLAVGGTVVLLESSLAIGGENAFGDGLALVTALFYASYLISVGLVRERYTTLTIMAVSATVAALVLAPVCLVSGERFLPTTTDGILVLVGLALVSHVGGQGLIAYALGHLPASFSAVTLLIQPAAAAFLAWGFFGEALTPFQAVGAAVVLVGILLARRGSARPRAQRE